MHIQLILLWTYVIAYIISYNIENFEQLKVLKTYVVNSHLNTLCIFGNI